MPDTVPQPPLGYRIVYQGPVLTPFIAVEMLRPLISTTIWIADEAGRFRHGQLKEVPWVKEDQTTDIPAMAFADARPFYPRGIVCIAQYQAPKGLGFRL